MKHCTVPMIASVHPELPKHITSRTSICIRASVCGAETRTKSMFMPFFTAGVCECLVICIARTLLQSGRVVLPMDEEMAKKHYTFWKSTLIFSRPILDRATLMKTSDMCVPEDMSEAALPSTTDATTHINPPEKHQQIGPEAAGNLLRGFLQGLEVHGRRIAILCVDLSTHTCDVTRAFFTEYQNVKLPMYYTGLCQDAHARDWAIDHMQRIVTDRILSGELTVSGQSLPAEKVPDDVIEALPPKPSLNVLVWATVKRQGLDTIKTPDNIIAKWKSHPVYGDEFSTWLQEAQAAAHLDVQPEATASEQQVRHDLSPEPSGSRGNMEPPAKRTKVEGFQIQDPPIVVQVLTVILRTPLMLCMR